MRSLNVRILSLLAAILVAGPALADDTGWYIGGSVNRSFENFDVDLIDFDDATGLGFRAGHRFRRWIAAEIQYEWSGEFDGDLGIDVNSHVVTLNAKLFPLRTEVQPYALVGVGTYHAEIDAPFWDDDETGATWRFGGGVEVPLDPHWRLLLEATYVKPTGGDVQDFEYTSIALGILYYFDAP